MKVKKVTIRDLLIAKGINPETADFKDIFGILDVTPNPEQAAIEHYKEEIEVEE